MKRIGNDRGVALVTALLLTLISLAIVMALLYLITQGVQLSAASKRYHNALEASYGGAEVFTKEIIPQLMGATGTANLSALLSGNNPAFTNYSCIQKKLNVATANWGVPVANWPNVCGPTTKTASPLDNPDATFTLMGTGLASNFNVYAKIVDTQPGNSDSSGTDGFIDSAAGVAYGAAGVSPKHMPATYRIEIQGQRANNPQEKAHLSVLYAY
jgi:hypothetical protein